MDFGEELVRAIEISRSRHVDLCNARNSGLLVGPSSGYFHGSHPRNHSLDIQEFGISNTKIYYFFSLHEISRDFESVNNNLLQWIQYNCRVGARCDRWCSK